jgi:hypothetical protein
MGSGFNGSEVQKFRSSRMEKKANPAFMDVSRTFGLDRIVTEFIRHHPGTHWTTG